MEERERRVKRKEIREGEREREEGRKSRVMLGKL